MHLFVYGTLKKGGHNHFFLKDSKFKQHYKFNNHALVDLGHGFPYMIRSEGSVYGEVYEVDDKTIKNIDLLEGVPGLYKRALANYKTLDSIELAGLYYYYTDIQDVEHKKVKDNYWIANPNKELKILIDNRPYIDKPEKLVFHMRFFDGDRAPTNKSYMELVKARSHCELNTKNELLFLLDCINYGIVIEI